jgi:DNA-binding transcriptional LysR family regulator
MEVVIPRRSKTRTTKNRQIPLYISPRLHFVQEWYPVMNRKNSRQAFAETRNLKIDIRQLRHAVIAADFGSFRQAADACLIKQPTLSRSIRQLEHCVGATIFERSTGGITPTSAGRDFLRMARSILEQIDVLVATTRASGRGDTGGLAIGFCTSLTAGNLRASILDFKQRFPQIALATVERSRTRLATSLRNGVLDILIVAGNLPYTDCKQMSLWSERILVILPQDHSLAPRDITYWTDLRDETVLLSQYDPGRELEDLLKAKLVASSCRPRIERHDVSRGVIKSLISMGLGISLVLESDVGANFAGLTYREVHDGAGPSRIEFSAMWRPDNEKPALAGFIKLLSERYRLPS